MTETHREPSMAWWFVRTYAVRIVIGAVLVAALYGVVCVYMPYQREQRIAREIESVGGRYVEFAFDGPNWIPRLVRDRVPLWNRISGIDFENTQVTDAGLLHLNGLTTLKWLELSCTQVTDAGLLHLQGLTTLRWLDLENTQVTDGGLLHLQGLKTLKVLVLGNTQVTDAGLLHLKGLTTLEWLLLYGTQTTTDGRAALRKALLNCTITSDP